MRLNISLGNSKLGKVPNVSLPAIKTCPPNAPCIKECYCNSEVFYWQMAREKWEENYQLYQTDPYDYFAQLDRFLLKVKPKFFRFHVSGDAPNQIYVDNMFLLAAKHNKTNFLVFTKRFELNFGEKMPNFKVKYSAWGDMVPVKTPIAYVVPKDKLWAVSGDRFICQGKCDDCYFCWLNNNDVILIKH